MEELYITVDNRQVKVLDTPQFRAVARAIAEAREFGEALHIYGPDDAGKWFNVIAANKMFGFPVYEDQYDLFIDSDFLVGRKTIEKTASGTHSKDAPGTLTMAVREPSTYLAHDFENSTAPAQAMLHSLLMPRNKRTFFLEDGSEQEVNSDFLFIGTSTLRHPDALGIGGPTQSRVIELFLPALSAEDGGERMQIALQAAESWGLGEELVRQMVRFENHYRALVQPQEDGATSVLSDLEDSLDVSPANMELLLNWVNHVGVRCEEKDRERKKEHSRLTDDDIVEAFVDGVDSLYSIPEGHDRLLDLARALVTGDAEGVKQHGAPGLEVPTT
jgi:hypothetical protein